MQYYFTKPTASKAATISLLAFFPKSKQQTGCPKRLPNILANRLVPPSLSGLACTDQYCPKLRIQTRLANEPQQKQASARLVSETKGLQKSDQFPLHEPENSGRCISTWSPETKPSPMRAFLLLFQSPWGSFAPQTRAKIKPEPLLQEQNCVDE